MLVWVLQDRIICGRKNGEGDREGQDSHQRPASLTLCEGQGGLFWRSPLSLGSYCRRELPPPYSSERLGFVAEVTQPGGDRARKIAGIFHLCFPGFLTLNHRAGPEQVGSPSTPFSHPSFKESPEEQTLVSGRTLQEIGTRSLPGQPVHSSNL